MSANRLVEIPSFEWPNLRDMYVHMKNRSSSYYTLQNFINWFNIDQNSSIDIKIYSLNGDWETDGTFIVKVGQELFVNSLSEKEDRLYAALECIDKRSAYVFYGVVESQLATIEKYLINVGAGEIYNKATTMWYSIAAEEIKNFTTNPPEGYSLDSLQDKHVDIVNSVWPHRYEGSEKFVRTLIQYNLNVGLFRPDGELIAWCLQLPLGSLGLLQVLDQYKRKGFGQLVVRWMSKKLNELGYDVMAPVVVENLASRMMFEKLEFKIIDKVHWLAKPALKDTA